MSVEIVVIDDERTFVFDGYEKSVLYLRNSSEALSFLVRLWTRQWMNGAPEIEELWLDHDLGGEDTIMPIVDFLSLCNEMGCSFGVTNVYVHTMNPSARDKIVRILKPYNAKGVPLPNLAKT